MHVFRVGRFSIASAVPTRHERLVPFVTGGPTGLLCRNGALNCIQVNLYDFDAATNFPVPRLPFSSTASLNEKASTTPKESLLSHVVGDLLRGL